VSQQESPITITSLRPGHSYTIRILAVNTNNFQAASAPIRITTHPASAGDYFEPEPTNSAPSQDTPTNDDIPLVPVVRQYKAFLDGPAQNTPPPVTREHSNSQSHGRKSLGGGRRSTPTSPGQDLPGFDDVEEDTGETVLELTEKLELLRKETEDVEKQIEEEDDEFKASKATLGSDRDRLKQSLKEKDDISRDLKKKVAAADKSSSTAQNRKLTLENQLRDQQDKRTKMGEDMRKWEAQIEEIDEFVQEMEKEKVEIKHSTEMESETLRAEHLEKQAANRSLEDDIGAKRAQIKDLEEERKQLAAETNGHEETHTSEPDPRAMDWHEKEMALRMRFQQANHELHQAQMAYAQCQAQLDYLASQQRRSSQPHILSGMSSPDQGIGRRNSIRRPGSALNEPTSLPQGFVPATSGVSFNTSMAGVSPSFATVSPFFNINNGMAVHQRDQPHTSMPQAEIDILTGGAPMSPTTGESLLPSGLFGDEMESSLNSMVNKRNSGSLINQPLGPHLLPGLGAPQTLERDNQGPSSPVSIPSRSPSVFASPRESSSHLAFIPGTENMDSDRRSIRSTTSSLRAPAPSKFSSLFGFSRQRGKTLDEHGPALGTLKPSQSHSMPRQDELEQDPIGTRRRRGSHSGNWIDSMSNAFSRSSATKQSGLRESDPSHISARKRPFTMFGGTKGDDWLPPLGLNRPPSPRPGSIASLDQNGLPRPSTESQQRFGWPIDRAGSLSPATQSRGSALSPDGHWNGLVPPTSWSRVPSRRPSIHAGGSSTNLALDPDSLGSDSDELDDPGTASPSQAPIGTRPSKAGLAAARLNPTAPNFKSLFSKGTKADKPSEKSGRSKGKDQDKDKDRPPSTPGGDAEDQGFLPVMDSSSPSNRRKSRDGRSISTAADSTLSEPRSSLDRISSRTPSETQLSSLLTSSSAGKESFMSKLSRKSSSNKFNFPFGKEKTSGNLSISSKKGVSGTSDVGTVSEVSSTADEDFGATEKTGTLAPTNKSSALSWSNIKRMGRRGDKTPSVHESLASESNASGDEDDSREDSSTA
jgi:hypothetical protein